MIHPQVFFSLWKNGRQREKKNRLWPLGRTQEKILTKRKKKQKRMSHRKNESVHLSGSSMRPNLLAFLLDK